MHLNPTNLKNKREIREYKKATEITSQIDDMAKSLQAFDNSKHDLNPQPGGVAVDGLRLSGKSLTGSCHFDPNSGETHSAMMNYGARVEIEVDHMCWGTYTADTTLSMEKSPEGTKYNATESVDRFFTRTHEIDAPAQGDAIDYKRETEDHGYYYNRVRGRL